MENALEIRKLRKEYDEFVLDDISMDLPAGNISRFVVYIIQNTKTVLHFAEGMRSIHSCATPSCTKE